MMKIVRRLRAKTLVFSYACIARVCLLAVAAMYLLPPEAPAGMFRRRDSEEDVDVSVKRVGAFPETGEVEGLVRIGKILTYKSGKFQELYGAAGNRYIQYGMLDMMSCDYEYDDQPVSIEIANMMTNTAAAGLFHHHRGNVLHNKGRPVDVGAEGVIDAARDNRNLYFYRGKQFVKIVYSGRPPVPPLIDIADVMDSQMPRGRDDRPDGFEYIRIEGVNESTVELTPGFTFGYNFLPPAVWASAPGGGSPASDLFIITKVLDRDVMELYDGYNTYLRLNAKYYEEYQRGTQSLVKAVDPRQGRVVLTAYKNCLIIAARPDGYEKGEVLIDRVMDRIDEVRGSGRGSAGGEGYDEDAGTVEKQGKPRRRGLFRRRTR